MKTKRQINKIKTVIIVIIIIIFLSLFAKWSAKPENLGGLIDSIEVFFENNEFKDFYNAKSLLVLDLSNDNDFLSKNVEDKQIPASLAKLFVIEYASKFTNLDDIVLVNNESLALTKQGSSVANIKKKKYYLKNLFAAMLVPSGNDAAYVVADYCGGIISKEAKNSKKRINVFMNKLNEYLKEEGYNDTKLYDPSGYDPKAQTTVSDLSKVVKKLLKYQWFRDIVSKTSYTAILPNKSKQTWKNTNVFLDPTSEYYNENVLGVKTGSLSNDYNLIVLYKKHGKEFLICNLGSKSDVSRYNDVNYILKTIDESDYLRK
ncbi:MAG: D-alanyl-D-alanine carboxypeptidase family protein [Clostridia bacterium]|jgi:hypothetical protein